MIAWLCPGQGAQHPAMFGVPEIAAAAARIGAAAEVRVDASTLATPAGTQLALLAAALASRDELAAAGVAPALLAGHSVGAFAAAAIAGVIGADDAARIVADRAARMAAAFPAGFGMAAVTGLALPRVEGLVAAARSDDDPLERANVNAPQQVVVAGARPALERLVAAALAAGARTARVLDVPVPSHASFLAPVAQGLRERWSGLAPRPPRVPIASSVSGRLLRDGPAVLDDALGNVAAGIRWDLAAEALAEAGATLFVELRPGHVLRDLADAAFPGRRAVALEDAGARGVAALAARTLRES